MDSIYMRAVQAMTGHGGWPLTAIPHAGGRPLLRGHLLSLPSPGTGCLLSGRCWPPRPTPTTPRREEVARAGAQLTEVLNRGATEPQPASGPFDLVRRQALRPRRIRGRTHLRSHQRRLRRRAQVPPAGLPRLPAADGRAGVARGLHGGRTRCRAWRRAAFATTPGAASTATPSTRAGLSPTSRRCSTTTR